VVIYDGISKVTTASKRSNWVCVGRELPTAVDHGHAEILEQQANRSGPNHRVLSREGYEKSADEEDDDAEHTKSRFRIMPAE
jgi:hypothetical protein